MNELELFQAVEVAEGVTRYDVCSNRHRGNELSEAANPSHSAKSRDRQVILNLMREHGSLTCDEACAVLHRNPNEISGRFSELKRDAMIRRVGTRPTRTGSLAGVYTAI